MKQAVKQADGTYNYPTGAVPNTTMWEGAVSAPANLINLLTTPDGLFTGQEFRGVFATTLLGGGALFSMLARSRVAQGKLPIFRFWG